MRQNGNEAVFLLNSWKEIAEYLGRGVRTVQRWEHELGLPVHRIGNGRRSPVYATISELKFWMNTSEATRGHFPKDNGTDKMALVTIPHSKPLEHSRRLLLEARDLAKKIAEASVRQRQQAEDLYTRVLQMRERVK